MSKLIRYECNGNNCEKSTSTVADWLTIGTDSDENSLYVENNLPDAKLTQMNNYSDVHFCSSKCFIDYFIKG